MKLNMICIGSGNASAPIRSNGCEASTASSSAAAVARNPRLHLVHPPRRERARRRLAQAAVRRRVEADHRRLRLVAAVEQGPADLGRQRDQRQLRVRGAERLRVEEHALDVRVARDHVVAERRRVEHRLLRPLAQRVAQVRRAERIELLVHRAAPHGAQSCGSGGRRVRDGDAGLPRDDARRTGPARRRTRGRRSRRAPARPARPRPAAGVCAPLMSANHGREASVSIRPGQSAMTSRSRGEARGGAHGGDLRDLRGDVQPAAELGAAGVDGAPPLLDQRVDGVEASAAAANRGRTAAGSLSSVPSALATTISRPPGRSRGANSRRTRVVARLLVSATASTSLRRVGVRAHARGGVGEHDVDLAELLGQRGDRGAVADVEDAALDAEVARRRRRRARGRGR